MPTDDFQVFDSDRTTELLGKERGPYKKPGKTPTPVIDFESDGFTVLNERQTEELFQPVSSELLDSLPAIYAKKRNSRDSTKFRPICFIDGEGANVGEKTVSVRKHGLKRWVQQQNYALLGATLESGEYRHIVGWNNTGQIHTRDCFRFILDLPADHILIGYALGYDIEHWLKSLSPVKMEKLNKNGWVSWKQFRIHYIPNKIFTVTEFSPTHERITSRTIYDVFGFFQCTFKTAIRTWNVGTTEEWQFIDRMKDARPDFGPITEEVKSYNKQEGLHGIQMFSRVRTEYTKLELELPKPVGAGSIASAMFRKHQVREYFPRQHPVPVSVMLSSYFGGRFDISRIGFVGDVFESDINSAYPHIARNLPCLRCGRYETAKSYEPSEHSLWLVRWSDNGTRWSPFPYRTDNGHIRYYTDGIGYYYDREVRAGILLGSCEVLGGYRYIQNCEHRPFGFLEEYHQRRQEMLRVGDFGEQIIKGGSNSVYGKLAQSKGKNPPYQNLMWAGMITSGTRAMLLDAIRQNPDGIIATATDAVFSSVPLQLEYDDTALGAWKTETLTDLLMLGNGVYHSTGSSNPKHANGVAKNRGYARGESVYFNWEQVRADYAAGKTSIVCKKEFRGFLKASREHKLEERCAWIDMEIELTTEMKHKRVENELVYPLANPTPNVISAPSDIQPAPLQTPNSLDD